VRAQEITDAIVVLAPTFNSTVAGIIRFALLAGNAGVRITGRIEGLEPGSIHGFHVHDAGDISDELGLAAGGHFNPLDTPHACPPAVTRHAGDLGNIQASAAGLALVDILDANLPLNFPGAKGETVIGRAVIVHENPDDCVSQPAGNAGARLAQGVIGICTLNCASVYDIDNAAAWKLRH